MSRPASIVLLAVAFVLLTGDAIPACADVRDDYAKSEHMVPMRDGTRLYTAVYAPRDTSRTYPMLMLRTPYSCRPYGPDAYRSSLGPDPVYMDAGYVFVYQDVRGCYMSEGVFDNMTPHVPKPRAAKRATAELDESTDTWDTIEWLLEHVPNHNGRVGITGISYPGFYAAASMIEAHPALKASSPQAPIADWWFDDFHHHGAFFLPHAFNFLVRFGQPRPEPTPSRSFPFDHGTRDGYEWFLRLGPLRHYTDRYMRDVAFWRDVVAHPNYDDFWQARNILPHLDDVAPAVLVVGGWFDAEDLYGPLQIYRSIEARNPDVDNRLVMGPWRHGGWHRGPGDRLGNIHFGSETSPWFVREVEFPFFEHHLRGGEAPELGEATVFETGRNRWRSFDAWPPALARPRRLYCAEGGVLADAAPTDAAPAFDEWTSDPTKPVPFTEDVSIGMTREYMTDDQRFAARRPDVVTYQTPVLEEPLTVAGPIVAHLWVSTSGTASDWIVKVIDVFPGEARQPEAMDGARSLSGYQMMVRSEVMRGRFRESYEHPQPFVPNEPTLVRLPLQDVLHTFEPGHRLMIQVQSTWFPLVDRNPHRYAENVFMADESDFVPATQRVHRDALHPTRIELAVLVDE